MSSADDQVKTIKSKDEYEKLVSNTKYVALQAHAVWCGPCRSISPIFKKFAKEHGSANYVFADFDIDEIQELAKELEIRSVPAFFFFKDGVKVADFVGSNPAVLEKTVKSLSENEKGATAA